MTEKDSDLLTQPLTNTKALSSPSTCRLLHHKLQALRPSQICLPSKAALLIAVWTLVIGAMYAAAVSACVWTAFALDSIFDRVFAAVLISYSLLALSFLFYPLGGFLADVYCGRYRMVVISMAILCLSCAVLSVGTSLLIANNYSNGESSSKKLRLVFCITALVWFIFFTIGLGGYQANFIQFGLDQLIAFPSKYLGLFVHWVGWFYYLGVLCLFLLFARLSCHQSTEHVRVIILCLPFLFLVILVILLLLNLYSRRWFHTERGHHNPYKMVLQVLNFARKHKKPICRTAVTYCDHSKPTRLDYAKDRYGGPFTSEQAEDVKTFLRILGVLFSLGIVFVLEVPTSYFMFPLFALHTGTGEDLVHINCSGRWIVLEMGSLKYMSVVLLIPVYICFVYSGIVIRVPKILYRLWLSVFLYLLGALSMMVIDVIGHIVRSRDHTHQFEQCMLIGKLSLNHDYSTHALDMHWSVLILPSMLLGIAPMLVTITAFEFISAQSPQSMKGLLVGVFFAIKGLFQLLSSILLVPFSLKSLWKSDKHSPITNCGFGYFLLTILIALCGLIVFTVVAWRYKYRQRGEQPYGQSEVEDVYQRMIESDGERVRMRERNSVSDVSSILWSTSLRF